MTIASQWSLRIPNDARLEAFLRSQTDCDFSYPDVGATAQGRAPAGFDHDDNRVLLGHGEAAYQAASESLRQWRQFPPKWTRVFSERAPIAAGTNVAVLIRAFGLWRLNAGRIVYVVDQAGAARRFGFAFGTLPAHAERGEERFVVEYDSEGNVWYEIRSFSRPGSLLPRMGYPLVRWLQRRFVHDSQSAMHRWCNPG